MLAESGGHGGECALGVVDGRHGAQDAVQGDGPEHGAHQLRADVSGGVGKPDPAGDGVLGHDGVGEPAQLVQAGLFVRDPELTGILQVVRDVVAQDFQGAVHPGTGGHGGLRGTAQVRVIEVGEPVGRGADFLAHAAFLPDHQRVVGAHARQQRGDRVTVADHHAVHTPDLAGLGLDAQAAGRADEGQGRFGAGAGDFHGRGAAGLGERAVDQERAAPDSFGVRGGAVHHYRRKAAHGAPPRVQEPGLAGEGLTVAHHPHHVAAAAAQAAAGDHDDLALVAVHLGDGGAQPPGGRCEVDFGLDHYPARDNVQPAGEAEHRRYLGLAD
ncbi:hypothetical protein SRABI128_03396 [Microbacterium sp. Bi128]|nr:hypothetical protein SRABI128_03396 [Microbacterium sp. Bi128]